MKLPSFSLMTKLEDDLNGLILLESRRQTLIPSLSEFEEKFLNSEITKDTLVEEYKKKVPELPKESRSFDSELLKIASASFENYNDVSKILGLELLPYSYMPGVAILRDVRFTLKRVLEKPGKEKFRPAEIKVLPEEKAAEVKELIKERGGRVILTPEAEKERAALSIAEKPEVIKEREKIKERVSFAMPKISFGKRALPEFKPLQGFITSMSDLFVKEMPAHIVEAETERIFDKVGEKFTVLVPEFAFAQTDKDEKGNIYTVYEPKISSEERDVIELVKNKLVEKVSLDTVPRETLFKEVSAIFDKEKLILSEAQKDKVNYYLTRDLYGLGRVEPLMHDPLIEDIECDGINMPIFIVHRNEGHLRTNVIFYTNDELRDFIIKLSQLGKAYVSYAAPILDTILPDGSRVNAVLTESIATRGPSFTIRKFPEKPFSPIDLVKFGSINEELLAFLWTAIEFKRNILIIGPTAAGKTTLLNALAMFIPKGQRVVSIEDTRELNLIHDNWLPQVSRMGFGPPDVSGKKYGSVLLIDLIKESFRQRPDYLIIGEVRGEETFVMFQGMSAGHTSFSTFHAKTVEDVVSRLITPPINLHPSLLDSLDIVVVVAFAGIGTPVRKVRQIIEIKSFNAAENRLDYEKLYEWIPELPEKKPKKTEEGYEVEEGAYAEVLPITYRSLVLKEIAAEYGIDLKRLLKIIQKRVRFLEEMHKKGVSDYVEFAKKLSEFKSHESF